MEEILELCAGLPECEFAPGDDLMSQGSDSGTIHVLISGVVGVEVGGVLITRVAGSGAFLGEISALLNTTHSARVFALEPTRTYRLAADQITSNPALLLGVARLLATRLNAVTSYLVDLRHQYGDETGHLSLMAEVLSDLTTVAPVTITPGSARGDVPDY